MAAISPALSAMQTRSDGVAEAGLASAALRDWIAQLAPVVPVTLAGGAHAEEPSGIAIRLAAVVPRVVPFSSGRKSSALALDYLVTVRLDDALAEHNVVSEIAFAVIGGTDYEIVGEPSVAELCSNYGIVPAPGLILRAEIRRDAVVPLAPLVREAPTPNLEPLIQARGRVVGPGNIPISGALVTVAGSNRSCTTGPDGRFRFAIPAGQPATVTARARSREVSASLAPETETILTLQMEA